MNSKQPQPWIYAGGAIAFTIAIVAVIVPWLFPELSWQHRAAKLLERRGSKVQVTDPADLSFHSDVFIRIDGTNLKLDEAHLCGAFAKVAQLEISNSDTPEAFLAALANPDYLRSLTVNRCLMTPDLLVRIKSFQNVEYLRFSGREVTDEVLKQLSGISKLRGLDLIDTSVTAEGLQELIPLSRIGHLNLKGTEITSAGVAAIAKMKLSLVTVSSNCIKGEDLSKLRAAYPGMVGEPGEPPGLTVVP